jgi:6-phosphogluconolactonase/glucosamine-6-phosphate isomerase/deaminase
MLVEVVDDYETLSDRAAAALTEQIRKKPDSTIGFATGERKASAIRKTLEGPLTAMVPASMVQMHRVARGIVDEEAASALDYEHHHGIAEPKEQ